MKRKLTFTVASLLMLFGGSTITTAQVKNIRMKIDGYLCGY